MPGIVIRRRATAHPGSAADLRVQRLDLRIELRKRYSQDPQGSPRRCGQSRVLVHDQGNKATCIRRTPWHDPAVLGEVSAERVDDLSSLPDEQFSDPEDAARPLRFLILHGHEAQIRSLRRLADRLGVCRILFCRLTKGFRRTSLMS